MSERSTPRKVRPFYWSVRREIWENRAVYIAPLAVAGVVMFGFLIGTLRLPANLRAAMAGGKGGEAIMLPYPATAALVLGTSFIVAVFYCLSALQGERRDRSLLFWKSLPVSDLITVLAKFSVPMLVLPAVVLAVSVAANVAMLAWSLLVVLANGLPPGEWISRTPIPQLWLALATGLPFLALWLAPVYAWLLLVSAWAKRMTFLWAVAPPLALGVFERLALGSSHVLQLLDRRFAGGAFGRRAEGKAAIGDMDNFDPGVLPYVADLWIGLILAGLFLAAAVRLRRSREPI